MSDMAVYLVGGAVRDRLLGRAGATAIGWSSAPPRTDGAGRLPAGGARTSRSSCTRRRREEYALARIERKTGPGYHGFVFRTGPDVTLEDDLSRRDLTINAMAMDADGHVVDPWGGQADLAARVLRHVGPAFAEDPVRILRLARFAARFTDFAVAPQTLPLCRAMVGGRRGRRAGARAGLAGTAHVGLMEAEPSRMIGSCASAARWRGCCPRSTRCSACRSVPSTTRRSTPARTC